jgi:hypothetical protein
MRYLACKVGPKVSASTASWTEGVVVANEPLDAAKDMLVSMAMLPKRPTNQRKSPTQGRSRLQSRQQ